MLSIILTKGPSFPDANTPQQKMQKNPVNYKIKIELHEQENLVLNELTSMSANCKQSYLLETRSNSRFRVFSF